MKKANKLLALLLATACVLAGCGQQAETPASGEESNTQVESNVESTVEGTDAADAEDSAQDEDAAQTGEVALTRTAHEIVDSITLGWNLGNTLDAHMPTTTGLATETCWGNPNASKELIDLVKSAGFNTVRVPVTWYNHMN